MKIKAVTLKEAVVLPGISGDFTLTHSKQYGIDLKLDDAGNFLIISYKDQVSMVPRENIKSIVLE